MASGIVRVLTSPVALYRPRFYRLHSSIAGYLSVNLLETTTGINKRKFHHHTDNDAKIVICNVSIKRLMKQLAMSAEFPVIVADIYISSRLINSIYSSYFEQCFHAYDKVPVVPVEELFKQPAMYFPIINSCLYGYTTCDKEMDNCEQIVPETNQNTDMFEDIKVCGNDTELNRSPHSPEQTDQIDSVKTRTSISQMNSLSNNTECEKGVSDTDGGLWLVPRKWCNEHEPKRKKGIRRREQGVKKKWKPLEDTFVGFERSLLPRRQSGIDGEEIERLNDEIQFAAGDDKIEEDAESAVEEKPEACVSNTINVTEGDETLNTESNSEQVLTNVAATELDPRLVRDSSYDRWCDTDWDYECDDDVISDLEDMLDKNAIDKLNRYIDRRCHRSKKKRKIQKAHKQVKTKYCRTISNSSRGRKFYINHRVRKTMLMPLECLPLRWRVSVKQIDKSRGVKFCSEIKETIRQAKSDPTRQPPSARVGRKPMHTLTAFNADDELSPELVNILLLLQERDIMPEDYDMLLRLDDRVEAKTIDSQTLDSFETDTISEETAGDACPVCMDPYIVGESRKRLPCGHKFHSKCIEMWLTNSSINCPLDGVPVMTDS